MNTSNETLITKLSIAINLKDKYTKKQPIGKIKVSLKNLHSQKATRNTSGYYLFLNIPEDDYTIKVGSNYYICLDDIKAQFIKPNPGKPIEELAQEILLYPNPCYPFPNSATIIRGQVKDENEKPVPHASVELIERPMTTYTDENGWYVIFFSSLTFTAKDTDTDQTSDIIIKNHKRIIKTQKTSLNTIFHIKASTTINAKTFSETIELPTEVEECTSITAPAIKLNTSS
jgi:hypothetical protein